MPNVLTSPVMTIASGMPSRYCREGAQCALNWAGSGSPAQALDPASIPLRGPAGSAISDDRRWALLAWRRNRSAVLVVEHCERRARPLLDESDDDDDPLCRNRAGSHRVAESHRVGWLRTRPVDPDVTGLAGRRSGRPCRVEANRPQPGVDAHVRRCGGSSHGPSLGAMPVGRAGPQRVTARAFPCPIGPMCRPIKRQNEMAKSTARTMTPRTKMMVATTIPSAT